MTVDDTWGELSAEELASLERLRDAAEAEEFAEARAPVRGKPMKVKAKCPMHEVGRDHTVMPLENCPLCEGTGELTAEVDESQLDPLMLHRRGHSMSWSTPASRDDKKRE